MYLTLFDYIGKKTPFILLIILLILSILYKSFTFILIIILLFIINFQINYYLKGVFKQNRPNNNNKLSKLNNNNKYGMPSGHSQTSALSVLFIIYLFDNVNIYIKILKYVSILLLFITSIQRIYFSLHTYFQVICGLIIGFFNGFISLYLFKILKFFNY